MQGLRYTGRGCGMFLHGIPARDLTAEEVEEYGGERKLLKSGIYGKAQKPAKAKREVG